MAATVKVWDPMVRVFHWSLAAGFLVAWVTADEWDQVHEIAGYCVAALVVFRLIWGLIGPHYARFAQFVRRPAEVLAYGRDVLAMRERRYIGHNPAGAAMVVALLMGGALTALSGWLSITDRFWGVEWVEETHEFLASGLMFLVVLHIAGVVFSSFRHGENLVRAMVSGRKRRPAGGDVA